MLQSDTPPRVALGMIHGRFQPFHCGHLEYLLHALERCERLTIGITNPDPWTITPEATSDHRHRDDSNPFTFYERARIIEAVLDAEDIHRSRWMIVPFPINFPERYRYYAPREAVQFIRVFSPWEATKANRLREAGYHVEILDPGSEKEIEATEVRELIRDGGAWERLVPPAAASAIRAQRPEWFT